LDSFGDEKFRGQKVSGTDSSTPLGEGKDKLRRGKLPRTPFSGLAAASWESGLDCRRCCGVRYNVESRKHASLRPEFVVIRVHNIVQSRLVRRINFKCLTPEGQRGHGSDSHNQDAAVRADIFFSTDLDGPVFDHRSRYWTISQHKIRWRCSERRGGIGSAQLYDARKMLRLRPTHFPGSGRRLLGRSKETYINLGPQWSGSSFAQANTLCPWSSLWGSNQPKNNVMNKAVGHDFPLRGHRARSIVMHS
jgi:hypothetical protein